MKDWQFWVDRGGTFTDIVAKSPDGGLHTHKLLSANPEQYQDAVLQGIRDVIRQHGTAFPHAAIAEVKMGTTVATNALLERKGEKTALLMTQGMRDCLQIGYQNRPDIFALHIKKPQLLYTEVVEIKQRTGAKGEVIVPLDIEDTRSKLQGLYDAGFRSLAIVFMHAWRYCDDELEVCRLAGEIGFQQISASHQVSPLMKLVGRADTTVVDAYLSPVLQRYVHLVKDGLAKISQQKPPRLWCMQSNGGLADADFFQGKDSILSGPAGGIVGAVSISKHAGIEKMIAFDMGGTSTDVAHYAGELERSFETEVAGVRMRTPMMHIHTVAAGGGSILHFDGMRYRVGADSAGADPGPAAYRRGGPLTVTDANVMLGKLPMFPSVFGEDANQSLDERKVSELFTGLAQRIAEQSGNLRSPEQVAEGFLRIAIENMANAIKRISVQKGYNVTEYTLCCYGAAGGQHACKLADRLAMQQILIHPFAGVLSAYGMGLADFRVIREKTLEVSFNQLDADSLQTTFNELQQAAEAELAKQNVRAKQINVQRQVLLRYQGTDTALKINYAADDNTRVRFEERYFAQFGFIFQDKALILETALVELIAATESVHTTALAEMNADAGEAVLTTQIFSNDQWHCANVYQRMDLQIGQIIQGVAVIVESTGTTVIEPGWQAQVSADGSLLLSRFEPLNTVFAATQAVDPVLLEVFNQLFMSIAEQMGFVLQNTAYSVNIKERLDFSCAVFDRQGRLIANAPHIPVHLGSMGDSVAALLEKQGSAMRAGDVFMMNSPYLGGTHLPDITVVTPVFAEDAATPLFFVASRGHHTDIGGITPGSMPPDSRHIDEEGCLHSGLKIVSLGAFQEQSVRQWLLGARFPARNPEQNIADLQAQVAANAKGAKELLLMVRHYSLLTVQNYMTYVRDNAEQEVKKVLSGLQGGRFSQQLDNGLQIHVNITVDQHNKTALVDFSGTSAQSEGNFNAPLSVCRAAVLYVFRTLVAADIPLNAGCLMPVSIRVPEKSLLNPQYPAAVVAGNVETSQHIVDALYGALGVLAGSQGTMNNLTFGNQQYQYYETICGGTGAGQTFPGCSAVQSHMTNSRITDPEVLEWRYPVILEEFALRANSGGAGELAGGDGVKRRIRFNEPMTVGLLSSHRKIAPAGLKKGSAGKTGENYMIKANGIRQDLPGCCQIQMQSGDAVQIETPGGGGFRKA